MAIVLTLLAAISALGGSVFAIAAVTPIVAPLLFPPEWRDDSPVVLTWLILQAGAASAVVVGTLVAVSRFRGRRFTGAAAMLYWYGLIVSFTAAVLILADWEEVSAANQFRFAAPWLLLGLGCGYGAYRNRGMSQVPRGAV